MAMAIKPAPHVVGPRDGHPHPHTIIFLHGRGSTNQELADEFFESEASEPADLPRTLPDLFPTIRWVFPAAPVLRAARFDTDMSQWFDMWAVENPTERAEIQHDGLRRSVEAILEIVRDEEAHFKEGMPKIFLAGISQGFATAVAAYFSAGARNGNATTTRLAGLIGLSSWMPLGSKADLLQVLGDGTNTTGTDHAGAAAPRATSVLLCHSADDDVVPVRNGRALRDALEQASHEVEWHEYVDGGHWVNEPQGVDDMVSFLRRHM